MSAPKLNVADVAGLARLSLTPDETTKFTAQLSQILAHMETLGQIPTGDVPEVVPPAQPALRPDMRFATDVRDSGQHVRLWKNALAYAWGFMRLLPCVRYCVRNPISF